MKIQRSKTDFLVLFRCRFAWNHRFQSDIYNESELTNFDQL